MVKKIIFKSIVALLTVLVGAFLVMYFFNPPGVPKKIYQYRNLKSNDGVTINLDPNKLNNPNYDLSNPKNVSSDRQVCLFLPQAELTGLGFNKKFPVNNTEVEFKAQYDQQKLPALKNLLGSLETMLKLACEQQIYPMKNDLVLPADIWHKFTSLTPKPFTYYSGTETEYYSIGFKLDLRRWPFDNKEQCKKQPLFKYGDAIIFYGSKTLSKSVRLESQVLVKCMGQYESLDHWEIQEN